MFVCSLKACSYTSPANRTGSLTSGLWPVYRSVRISRLSQRVQSSLSVQEMCPERLVDRRTDETKTPLSTRFEISQQRELIRLSPRHTHATTGTRQHRPVSPTFRDLAPWQSFDSFVRRCGREERLAHKNKNVKALKTDIEAEEKDMSLLSLCQCYNKLSVDQIAS